MEKGSLVFVVRKYSRHRGLGATEALGSEEFLVGGHGWKVLLYPGGVTTEAHNSGHVSLSLRLNTTTSKTVQFLFAFHVVRKGRDDEDLVFSTFGDQSLSVACLCPGIELRFPRFIKRTRLEYRGYLEHDDCLRIRATIGVLACPNENLPIAKGTDNNWSDFGKLLQSKQEADVFFNVGKERFCGHRWILAARCPAVLSDCPETQEEIDIPDMEPKIFEVMLGFVYTGMLPEGEFGDSDFGPSTLSSFMGKLLAAADRFGLERLKKICESRISERISGKSVAYLLHLAQLCHAKELKAACLRFEAQNETRLLDVMDSDGREYLKEACPLVFLELGYSTNGRQEHNLCGKIFSTMKKTVVNMLGPQHETGKRKIKNL